MPEIIPAPVNPKLGFAGIGRVKIPNVGLDIAAGIGLAARIDNATPELFLDAITADPPVDLAAFVPGVMAAKTIGTFRNLKRSGFAVVTLLEANLLTAPVGVSGASCANLVLAGSVSGSTSLQLLAGHSFNDFSATVVPVGADGGTGMGENLNGSNHIVGIAQGLIPTADAVITSLKFQLAQTVDGQNVAMFAGRSLIAEILDVNRNVLASSVVVHTPLAFDSQSFVGFPLTNPYTVSQGVPYYFALRIMDAIVTDALSPYTGPTLHGANRVTQFGAGGDLYLSSKAARGATWNTYPTPSTDSLNGKFVYTSTGSIGVRCMGNVTGATLVGDITASLTLTGTPATPGSDLNLRVSIQAG